MLSEYMKLYPDVRIEVCEADCSQLCTMLLHHELDMALMTTEQRLPQLEYRLIASDEIVLLAEKNTALARRVPSGSTISLMETAEERFVLPAENTPTRRLIDEQFSAQGISPNVAIVCDNVETAKRACAACGLVLLSPFISLLGDYSSMQKLSHYHLSCDAFLPPFTMVCLREQPLAPYAEVLFTLLSNRYRAMTAYRP